MVTFQQYGTTYEGRELVYVVVTSAENQSNIEEIRSNNLKLAGFEEGIPTQNQKAIVWLSYNVHGNETSSSEAALNTIYTLITEKTAWLNDVVVIMDPMVNPDGRDRYVNWNRSVNGATVNTDPDSREHSEPWPGGRTNHYYFDLNRDEAFEIAQPIYNNLKDLDGVEHIEIAGSLRRRKETIGDIDILIGANEEFISGLFDVFTSHERVTEILGRGDTKSSVRTTEGRQVDLRIVKPEHFAAALMYFTGSKEHNVEMRSRARERGMSLNEYGLFELNENGETNFEAPKPFKMEADIYDQLGLNWVPPELREDRGEFEIFEGQMELPLVADEDIRGVIHAHSTWSDGKFSIKEMAEACIERGYEYLGITDHSKTAAYAGGLSEEQVKQQWEEIDQLNDEFQKSGTDFVIFKGIESDILADGSLDYSDDILDGFDFIIASVHQTLDMPRDKMMDRFRAAIKNPYTTMIGHPTGRLLLKRGESEIDLNELVALAAEHNTSIEINANPWRLDLDWSFGNKAKDVGLITSINPDAHSIEGIDYIKYGVMIARKGKYEKERVLNTKSAKEVMEYFKAR
jgi:DNA polymerase (family 10)